MTVLATIFKNNMSKRHGFLSINDFMEDRNMYYTFDSIFKLHQSNFESWVAYWEGSPVAVKCTVKADVMPNGFVKVAILTKDVVFIDEIGEYPASTNSVFGSFFGARFGDARGIAKMAQEFATAFTSAQKATPTREALPTAPAAQNAIAEVERYSKSNLIPDSEVSNFKDIIAKNWGVQLK